PRGKGIRWKNRRNRENVLPFSKIIPIIICIFRNFGKNDVNPVKTRIKPVSKIFWNFETLPILTPIPRLNQIFLKKTLHTDEGGNIPTS
ncbi:MAG: hypothetical protein Q4D62_12280, partial [Planctomycetia bacterium]|nr:hypothetical protein [Planctomycetia bacterium]